MILKLKNKKPNVQGLFFIIFFYKDIKSLIYFVIKKTIFVTMNIVSPDTDTHSIIIIPRYYPTGVIALELYNESEQATYSVDNVYIVANGKMTIDFDFNFSENDKYQVKVIQDNDTLYIGKLIATRQDAQKLKDIYNLYRYE